MRAFVDTVRIDGVVGSIMCALALDRVPLPKPTLAAVVAGDIEGNRFDGVSADAEIDGESLLVTLASKGRRFDAEITNLPAKLMLADDTTISAQFSFRESVQMSIQPAGPDPVRSVTRLCFNVWRWATNRTPHAWIGFLQNGYIRRGNAVFYRDQTQEGWSRCGQRFEGSYRWTLINTKNDEGTIVVVEADGDLEQAKLFADFTALEFVLGTPIRLDLLVGVDEQLTPVAAYGPHLGFRPTDVRPKAAPVPDGLHPEEDAAWVVPLFELLAIRLRDRPDDVIVGVAGYLDSLTDHLDVNYLKAQVALEALASSILKSAGSEGSLVKDFVAWQRWVRKQKAAIAEHAVDDEAVEKMLAAITSASRRPTSRKVAAALEHHGIKIDKKVLDEAKQRNVVAHTYSMGKDIHLDLDGNVRRVRMVQTLLAALVSRIVGYRGPVQGWDVDEHGYRDLLRWGDDDTQLRARADLLYEIRRAI